MTWAHYGVVIFWFNEEMLLFIVSGQVSMYDMGAWQFKIGKTTGFHRMMVSLIYYFSSKMVR